MSLDAVVKRFDDVLAVDGLSFEVEPGQVYGLIGPDGAGKTTTMRLIAGLISPDSGQIRGFGFSIPKQVDRLRSQMGYMPQQFSLYGDLSVQENLRFFAGMYGVSRKEMVRREKRLLEIAMLDKYRNRPAGALSGGMYKKLALACALIHRPELLLLDEPTNGVDPISRRELWAFLYELVKEGVSVLISTPYMDEAERCDRVGLIIGGKIEEEGEPVSLRRQFAHDVFEIATPKTVPARKVLGKLKEIERVYTVGKKLHAICPKGAGNASQLAEALLESDCPVESIRTILPSFEDVFLHVSAQKSRNKEAII